MSVGKIAVRWTGPNGTRIYGRSTRIYYGKRRTGDVIEVYPQDADIEENFEILTGNALESPPPVPERRSTILRDSLAPPTIESEMD